MMSIGWLQCPIFSPLNYTVVGGVPIQARLLGHTKMDSAVRYLGVELEEALAIAEAVEI